MSVEATEITVKFNCEYCGMNQRTDIGNYIPLSCIKKITCFNCGKDNHVEL